MISRENRIEMVDNLELRGEEYAAKLAYWKRQLGGKLPLLELPNDRRRSSIQTFNCARHALKISDSLTTELKRLSQGEGATLFMSLLAAFKVLLYRYTGQEDIIIGSPIALPDRSKIENLMGVFNNTLALRTQLTDNLTFKELLGQVRQVALDAYTHQDVPFEKLLEELQPERDLSHTPIFQVLFQLRNVSQERVEFKGVKFEEFECDRVIAAFDLTLDIVEIADGLACLFEYNADLFEAATIERMSGHFETLLKGILASPEQPISQLSLLTEAERHQLLVEWNDTETDYPQDKCIHQLFEEQVERIPDAIALSFVGEQLSYAQLNTKANQLAHYLQSLGVKPEVLVGLCVERSIETIIGILGILKAGGAYLPLDPTYPQEHLHYTLDDSGVDIVLTTNQCLANLSAYQGKVICFDRDQALIEAESTQNPHNNNNVEPHNLAYVIYTSGSTGKPKGVLVTHNNVVRLFTATQPWYNFDRQDVWTLFHSYSFDFSVWEIFGALIYGGKLVVVPYWLSRNPKAFYELLKTEKVTVLNQTPSAFNQLIQVEKDLNLSSPLSLRYIIFGGEELKLQSLQPWFNRHGDQQPQLVNMYGITETTVHVTYRPLSIADLDHSASVIGCSIPDLNVYLLDRYLQPVPIGVAGEIYVAGAGVSLGYLHHPQLNIERFIANPFSCDPEARLYKSGDLARYLSNGDIEYLGRIDRQVKIRGFRIELREIEAVLSQHPSIAQTVVIKREDTPDDKRLVAYLVPNDQSLSQNQLRDFLEQKLPEYMIPSSFVLLETLPLTSNGKIDIRALPVPNYTRPELEETFVAPRDELELQLTKIWKKVLGIKAISIHDNFFALGGDSLLAVRLFVQIEKTFGKNLPLSTLFQSATVAKLASIIRQKEWLAPWESLVAIQPTGNKPPLFYMHAGGGNLLVYRDLAYSLGLDQPVYGLQPRGLDGKYAPYNRIEDMAAHYLAQIRTFQPNGPYFLAGLSTGGIIAWEMAQYLHAQGQKVALLALFDSYGPESFKLLPPLPRLLSVLNWVLFDFLRRLSRLPLKLVLKLIKLGIKQTSIKILQRLGIVKKILDEDQKIHTENVQQQLKSRLAEYQSNSSQISPLEKCLDSLSLFLLKNSSHSYYATIFAGAMSRNALSELPVTLQKVQEANLKADQAYVPQVYPGRVILFRASERPPGFYYDPKLGWGDMAAEGMEIYEIPGDHSSIVKSPVLAEKLKVCIERYSNQFEHPRGKDESVGEEAHS